MPRMVWRFLVIFEIGFLDQDSQYTAGRDQFLFNIRLAEATFFYIRLSEGQIFFSCPRPTFVIYFCKAKGMIARFFYIRLAKDPAKTIALQGQVFFNIRVASCKRQIQQYIKKTLAKRPCKKIGPKFFLYTFAVPPNSPRDLKILSLKSFCFQLKSFEFQLKSFHFQLTVFSFSIKIHSSSMKFLSFSIKILACIFN